MSKKALSVFLSNLFSRSRILTALIVFGAVTLFALLNFVRFVGDRLANREPGRYQYYFIMETTGAYTLILLIPLLLWFFRKFPIQRNNTAVYIPLHLFASIVFGVSHTLLMYGSRHLIFWIADLGAYHYGLLMYRFPMEYSLQFFIYWTIYAIYILIQSNRENQEQRLKTAQLEEKLLKARLQALQMQLNPHFFFNTLNMISSTMYEDVKAADTMMAYLSDLMRITLKRKDEEYTLANELEVLKLYLRIMKARFEDKLIINMEISNETLEAKVPCFIMQPLVENSIKHSMETLKTAKIDIQSFKQNNRLILTVKDNGPGISANRDQIIKNGVGLTNTVERLEKIYSSNHRFQMENITEGGLRVVIDIPFNLSSGEESSHEKH